MKRVFRRVFLAYGFLTILPGLGKVTVEPGDTGKSTAYYPLVGLTLGALFIPFGLLAGLSDFALSVVLCVFSLFFSRALHADGLVDTFDGFLAGRRRPDDILRVMKDSRLGALGFIGALSVYLLKIAFMYEILVAGAFRGGVRGTYIPWTYVPRAVTGRFPLILSVVPALSRGGVPFACALFPYAGSEKGLGKSFVESVTFRQPLIAFLLMEAFCCFSGNFYGLLLPPLLFLFWSGWGLICMKKIGGMTGDTMGAGIELSELFSLIMIRILFT
jgi:adenosylcobinamide-GDP ribazoletransferase